MNWTQEFLDKHHAGVAHTFLLYFDIHGEVLNEKGDMESLNSFLLDFEPVKEAKIIAIFKRGFGLQFADQKMKAWFIKLLNWDEGNFEKLRKNRMGVLDTLDIVLHLSMSSPQAEDVFGKPDKIDKDKPLIAVIFEYTETLTPSGAACADSEPDRDNYVIFDSWAKDAAIRKNRNLIVLIADRLGSVPQVFKDPSSEIIPLKISLPELSERREAIRALRKSYHPLERDIEEDILVRFTAGLSRKAIKQIIMEAHYRKLSLTIADVFARKKKILEEQSDGKIQIMLPICGPDAIGALEGQKDYINRVAKLMTAGQFLAAPKGVLLVGAPGTGKTVFAESLAFVLDISLIIFRNSRNMFVGESERLQELIFDLIRVQAPVAVFQDEFDLMMPARGGVSFGDSGSRVDERLMAEYFKFMSDSSLRGKVFWIAATNRPDRLDSAMIRAGRFDEVMPFPLPFEEKERMDITSALLKKMEIEAKSLGESFSWQLTDEDIQQVARKTCSYVNKTTGRFYQELSLPVDETIYESMPYTGAEIEDVLRKALFLGRSQGNNTLTADAINKVLKEYLPARNTDPNTPSYDKLNDLAIKMTTSLGFLPEKLRKRAIELRWRTKITSDIY